MRIMLKVFILIFIIFSSNISATEKKLIIGVPEEWSKNLTIIKNLLEESYNEIGYDVIFRELPLARGIIELTTGRIDGEIARAGNFAREYNLLIVNPPYITLKGYAYYLKDKFKVPPTADQIKKGKIAYMRGSFTIENFYREAKSPVIVNSEKQLIILLNKSRVDFVTPVTTSFAKGRNNIGKVLLFEVSIYHVLALKNKDLVKKIEPALKKNLAKKKNKNLQKNLQILIQPT